MPTTATPWLDLARSEIGVREAPGAANNARVLAYYADAGFPEIRHDAVAWCAAFLCAVLERSGTPSPKSLSARDALKWGKAIAEPQVGAVAVLWRVRPDSWQGHVGFVTEWDGSRVRLISGNMGDAVTEQWFPRSQVLGFRVPVTAANSRTISAARRGAISGAVGAAAEVAEKALPSPDAILDMAEAGNQFAGSLSAAASVLPVLGLVASLLSVAFAGVALWARLDDLANKGR